MEYAGNYLVDPNLSMTPERRQPDISSLNRDRYNAMANLRRAIQSIGKNEATHERLGIVVVALAGLACRSVVPKCLEDTSFAGFIRVYCQTFSLNRPRVDQTEFARTAVQILTSPESLALQMSVLANQPALIKLLNQFQATAGLAHPLSVGWFRQCIIQCEPSSWRGQDHHRTRAHLDDLGSLTQWFTPQWISDFPSSREHQ